MIEQFIPHGSIESLDISVLLWVSRLDVEQFNAVLLRPLLVVVADEFWAIVRAYRLWLAAPLNELVEVARERGGRYGEVYFRQQAFAVVVVNDVA